MIQMRKKNKQTEERDDEGDRTGRRIHRLAERNQTLSAG